MKALLTNLKWKKTNKYNTIKSPSFLEINLLDEDIDSNGNVQLIDDLISTIEETDDAELISDIEIITHEQEIENFIEQEELNIKNEDKQVKNILKSHKNIQYDNLEKFKREKSQRIINISQSLHMTNNDLFDAFCNMENDLKNHLYRILPNKYNTDIMEPEKVKKLSSEIIDLMIVSIRENLSNAHQYPIKYPIDYPQFGYFFGNKEENK